MQGVHCTIGGPNGVIMDLVRSFSARKSAFISLKKPSPSSALVSLKCSAPHSAAPSGLVESAFSDESILSDNGSS